MSDGKGAWISSEVFAEEKKKRAEKAQLKKLNDYNDAMRDVAEYFKKEKEKKSSDDAS